MHHDCPEIFVYVNVLIDVAVSCRLILPPFAMARRSSAVTHVGAGEDTFRPRDRANMVNVGIAEYHNKLLFFRESSVELVLAKSDPCGIRTDQRECAYVSFIRGACRSDAVRPQDRLRDAIDLQSRRYSWSRALNENQCDRDRPARCRRDVCEITCERCDHRRMVKDCRGRVIVRYDARRARLEFDAFGRLPNCDRAAQARRNGRRTHARVAEGAAMEQALRYKAL